MSDESIKSLDISNHCAAPALNCSTESRVKLDGHGLKQNKVIFTHPQLVNMYIVYQINLRFFTQGADFKVLYLTLLGWLKTRILINILVPDMVFDLMHTEIFSLSIGVWFGKNNNV